MRNTVSYLSEIIFDKSLYTKWYAKIITNVRLVALLIASIAIFGIFNYTTIPRRLNPEVEIPIVIVNTFLPGASPSDIESLVTIPVEDKIKGLSNIDTYTSTSQDNVSSVVITFNSDVDPKQAQTDVQNVISSLTNLPQDAQTPKVQAIDFENSPVWTFIVYNKKNNDVASLMKYAKTLQDKLEEGKTIERVQTSGFDNKEIRIIISPEKLYRYGLNPITLKNQISQLLSSYPAGLVESDTYSYTVSIENEVKDVQDLRNIKINANGSVIALSEIADIQEKPPIGESKTYITDKKTTVQGVQFFVYKIKSVNIDTSGKEAKEIVEKSKQDNPSFAIYSVENTAELIDKQFSDLLDEFAMTILLVFINLTLFLGLRQAFISSLTIPLTVLSSITIINTLGLSLNFLTLFAFLLALGLLIDDTIVIVAAMTRYFKTGRFSAQETGFLVWRDFITPLWSTTITTLWSFLPLLLTAGIIGEFIKPIPIVVTATMLSSTTIAVIITLPLMMIVLSPHIPHRVKVLSRFILIFAIVGITLAIHVNKMVAPINLLVVLCMALVFIHNKKKIKNNWVYFLSSRKKVSSGITFVKNGIDNGVLNIEKISVVYMKVIRRIIQKPSRARKTLLFMVVFGIVAYALIPLGLVKNEFFPKTQQDSLYVSLNFPSGTTSDYSMQKSLEFLKHLQKVKGVEKIVLESGQQSSSFFGSTQSQSATQYSLILPEESKRKINSIQIAEDIRSQFKTYDNAKVSVQEASSGPPAGADIELKVAGNDLGELESIATQLKGYLEKKPGVTNVEISVKPSTSKIIFKPDTQLVSDYGVDISTIGFYLRTFISGFTIDTFRMDNEEITIALRISDSSLKSDQITAIQIPTRFGFVPLTTLGSLSLEDNPTIITRQDGKRIVSVSASVKTGYNIQDINNDLTLHANKLTIPERYYFITGGVNQENQKSVTSIFQAMIISFILILITMVLEFKSYRQALIVLLTIPLAVSGVFYIFALTGTALSFPALIGVLALFGIVVTNAVVVIEKINDNRRHGMNLENAIVDASGSRLEPIMLTSITAILGLIPITLSDPLWRGLGGAIISGLLFSGIIKLFFVPALYYLWMKE